MSRLAVFFFLLSFSHGLLSQENDSLLLPQSILYFDIERGQYVPIEDDKPLDDQIKVPLGFLQPKSPPNENKKIVIADSLKGVMPNDNCEVLKRIRKPSYTKQSMGMFKITAVEITECATIFYFKVKVKRNSKFMIPKGSCILIANSLPLFIKSVEGEVSMAKWMKKDISYKAFFPPIPLHAKVLDFRELNCYNKKNEWYVLGLRLE